MPFVPTDSIPGGKTQPPYGNSELWDDLEKLPPQDVASRSGASLELPNSGPFYTLDFLGTKYALDTGTRTIKAVSTENIPLEHQVSVVLLTYLIHSGKGPAPGLSLKEVGPFKLPLGDFFFKGPHELAHAPLEEAFGENPEKLLEIALSLGATRHHQGFKLQALPNAEVYVYLEPGDEEFPAEARFNFDSHIHYYLPLDAIFALVNCLSAVLVKKK
jgi:hypothetical protein